MLRRGRKAGVAAAAATLVLLSGCTGSDGGVRRVTAEGSGGEEGPPTAQPRGNCPDTAQSGAAVYGTELAGFAFIRADGRGLVGPDGREVVRRQPVTRRGEQVRVAGAPTALASLGRELVVLYESGRVFSIDSRTCAESARTDLLPASVALPAGSDILWDSLARSAGPTARTIVFGRYSPPGTEEYSGFAVELTSGLKIARAERYDGLVTDAWVDHHGEPLVLLTDGTVRELGRRQPLLRLKQPYGSNVASVSRGTSGVWVSGGGERENFLRRPNGDVTRLPKGAFSYPVVAHDTQAIVLLRSRAEAWIVAADGGHTAIDVGRRPADALVLGNAVLVVAQDSDLAVLIDWARRAVITRYPAGPAPAQLVPLG